MEFRILGPLEARADGKPVPLGGRKQRALLAILLLSANRVVSRSRLINELWGEESTGTSDHALDVQLSRLRKALGTDAAGDPLLATEPPGYVLRVAPGALDLECFERLLDEGRRALAEGSDEHAAETLREAESLWRGRALADLEFESYARLDVDRLEELRLAAVEDRIEAELALGCHRALVPELEALVAEHPFRERLREQQMLALYRCGRLAAALDAYRTGRALLIEELGLEPRPQLRELEQAILRQDAALELQRDESADAAIDSAAEPPRRRRRVHLALAAIGGALAVAAAVAAVLSSGASDHSTRVASVPLRPGANLLDAADGKPVAHIGALVAPYDQRFADGAFWIWNNNPNSIAKVDARSGRLLEQFPLPVQVGYADFAVDGNFVWVADWAAPVLYQIDARTGTLARRFRLSHVRNDTRRSFVIGVADGAVWVAIWKSGEILGVDTSTGRITSRLRGFPGIDGGAIGGGDLWASTPGALTRIDLATRTATAVAHIPGPHQRVALGGGYAWTANLYRGEVYQVDPEGHVAHTYGVGPGAWRLSYSDGTLWVGNGNNVTAIDATTGSTRAYRVGGTVSSVAAGAGRVLVSTVPIPSVLPAVDGLRGPVARFAVPAFVADPIDPAVAGPGSFGQNPYIFQIERATEANLLAYPDAPPPRGLRLRPEIAAAMPALSRDRRTYTFRIRRGYRFAPPSGRPVTAESVRSSIERALSPGFGAGAPAARYLGDVLGARTYHDGRIRHVSGLRVHGPTISITLTRPSPDFLERLSLPLFSPVPDDTPPVPNGEPGTVTALGPPSAGPYYIALHLEPALFVLKRNPYYRGPRPHRLAAIGFVTGLPADTTVARFLHGVSDVVELPDPAFDPGGALARRYGGAADSSGPRYYATTLEQTRFIAVNARSGPFSDRRLRRAAAYALNRTLLAGLWGVTMDGLPSAGKLEGSAQVLPPNVRRYRRATRYPLRPDVARTRALARGRRGIAVMALPQGCEQCAGSFELVRAALAQIGIDVRSRPVSGLAAVRSHPADFDLLDGTTALEYPDPASFLERMFRDDVPRAWLTATTRSRVSHLSQLSGAARDTAAVKLAARLETRDVPVIAIGRPVIGQLFSPHVGCRIFPGSELGVDLAALCRR
jgi:DNA-binding SARP family transcriptional activator/ABC-type oligopeptide transport system substrate-binding subunit